MSDEGNKRLQDEFRELGWCHLLIWGGSRFVGEIEQF